jgi:hypothetical protein
MNWWGFDHPQRHLPTVGPASFVPQGTVQAIPVSQSMELQRPIETGAQAVPGGKPNFRQSMSCWQAAHWLPVSLNASAQTLLPAVVARHRQ